MSMKDLKTFQEAIPNKEWPEHWRILHRMLQPIEWNWSSCIRSRQNLVIEKRQGVNMIHPFVKGVMKDLIEEWLEKEKHSGLWD